jgi:four helix bundle protein
VAWQRGIDLVLACYAIARDLPAVERFELASQLRRAATSVPLNIAEGCRRVHRGDLLRHLSIARGSTAEVETVLEICERLGYASPETLSSARAIADHVARMLTTLIRRLVHPDN